MKKQDIIRLIDYIALYDLATEIQRIVDTKILKKIYAFLIKEEKEFLEQASRLKSSHSSVRLPLDAWDGTEKELRLLLHKRGLARLGVAISGQHPDFIWYFSHQLDRGRGATLAKLAEAPNIPSVSILPIRQIEEILRNFFS